MIKLKQSSINGGNIKSFTIKLSYFYNKISFIQVNIISIKMDSSHFLLCKHMFL